MGSLISQANRTTVETRFEFAHVPEGWWAVVGLVAVVALVWLVIWLYRHEGRRGASPGARTALGCIRCLVLVGLAAVWLEPVLATYIHRWIDSYCIVLVDDSSSMDLQDRYHEAEAKARVRSALGEDASFPVRRADIVARLLDDAGGGLISELAERNRVKVYRFSDAPELLGTVAAMREVRVGGDNRAAPKSVAPIPRRFSAQGSATNASRAVRRSVESLGGAPLAGVVLLSDGGINQGGSVDALARYLEERRVPLHAVGVGDASSPRNVRVTEVLAPENAFKRDPFAVTAHVTAQGLAGETVPVRLYERSSEGGREAPVETQSVRVGRDGSVPPVVFTQARESVGRTTFVVKVPVREDESVGEDNVKQTVVNIIDDKMRVLLIAGAPSWEYRFVSRLLMRDATFDLSCWLQSADLNAVRDGNTIIETLPQTPTELFEYDAVILLDPNPAEFGAGWARSLESLVTDYAGGVLFAASRKYAPEFLRDPAVRRIVQLLPVSPDPDADLIINQIGHYQTRPWRVEIPDEAYSHAVMRLTDDVSETRRLWGEVAHVYWHYPVLREKPVATVLMRHGNPQMRNSYGQHVLLATQFVGSGRSAFLAFTDTWRWRRSGEELFDSFWVHLMRYLVEGKLLGAKKRATIYTEGETFQLGDAVEVSARLFDARFRPLGKETAEAKYSAEGVVRAFVLRRSAERPGWYDGRFTPDRTGSYEVSLVLPASGGADAVRASHSIQVVRPNIEIANPQMDRSALMALGRGSAGGGYYEVDEVSSLVSAIPDRHETTTVKARPRALWDRWWTLALLVGLLSVEWAVRKWVRLL